MRQDQYQEVTISGWLLVDGDLMLRFIERRMHPANKVPALYFEMFHQPSGELAGNINLRVGAGDHLERYAGHIGFGVKERHQGKRYAARATHLLAPLAKKLGMAEVWITCDPENTASRRSCELAGARLVEIVDVPPHCIIFKAGHPRKCRYLLAL